MSGLIDIRCSDPEQRVESTIYSAEVTGLGPTRRLTYEVTSSTGHPHPALTGNWALLALLVPAMRFGRSLRLDRPVSPLLLHFVRGDIQDLLLNFDSGLQRVEVLAEVSKDSVHSTDTLRIGTGFSAGVDSFNSLCGFQRTGTGDQLEVTDLFTFDVGAYGRTSGAKELALFLSAKDRTLLYSKKSGFHAHIVQSNLNSFYADHPHLEFVRTHTLRNASAAALFENELDIYLYASAYSYSELNLSAQDSMAHIDPILLPLLSVGNMRFVSSGAGSNRIDKTSIIARNPDAQSYLDVCVAPARKREALSVSRSNCSRCWKCYRTMVTLDALGELSGFSNVFDLNHYAASRKEILAKLKKRAKNGSKIDEAALNFYHAQFS